MFGGSERLGHNIYYMSIRVVVWIVVIVLGGGSYFIWKQRADEKAAAQQAAPVLWLIGKTGAGKTAIVSALTGDPRAEIGQGFQPCTREASFYDAPPEAPILRFLDTRGLEELLGGDVCTLVESFGMDCSPCADGSVACLISEVEEVEGQRMSGGVSPISYDEAEEDCVYPNDLGGIACSTAGAAIATGPLWILVGALTRRRRRSGRRRG